MATFTLNYRDARGNDVTEHYATRADADAVAADVRAAYVACGMAANLDGITVTGDAAAAHTDACTARALGMARENGADDDAMAREWLAVWDADGGRANYGACTCMRPALPYADGCQHGSPCVNVYIGRACALDATKRNGYTSDGTPTVTYLTDDTAHGVAAGSVVLALNPYTGEPSGRKYMRR